MTAPVVWMNGFPATGKFTIAKCVAVLHGNAILIDNHQLNDPVEAEYARDHPQYQYHRRARRQQVLETYVHDSKYQSSLVIFTDFQSNNTLGAAVAAEYQDAATTASRRFIPVYLSCSLATNVERIASKERLEGGTGKLTDSALLVSMRRRCELFKFEDCPQYELDSTSSPPRELATILLEYINKCSQ